MHPYAGHDGIQLAIGQIFDRQSDHLFPYYRDMLTCISAGLTAEEIIYNVSPRIQTWPVEEGICPITLPSLNGIFTTFHPPQETMPSMLWV
jgi:hypothetical protein